MTSSSFGGHFIFAVWLGLTGPKALHIINLLIRGSSAVERVAVNH
jgi:hypothetical protein